MEKNSETFQKESTAIVAHLKERLAAIRTDRASPSLVENVMVEYAGARLPLKQVGSIATPDLRSIVITPWDREGLQQIAKALEGADLGTTPVVSGDTVRITLPPLSEERRKILVRETTQRVEEVRISLRKLRDEVFSSLRRAKQEKTISEDAFFRTKEELDRRVTEAQKNIDEIAERKKTEILGT